MQGLQVSMPSRLWTCCTAHLWLARRLAPSLYQSIDQRRISNLSYKITNFIYQWTNIPISFRPRRPRESSEYALSGLLFQYIQLQFIHTKFSGSLGDFSSHTSTFRISLSKQYQNKVYIWSTWYKLQPPSTPTAFTGSKQAFKSNHYHGLFQVHR